MATHSNIPAWVILWTQEPGGLQSMGSQESDVALENKPSPHQFSSVQFSSSAVSHCLQLHRLQYAWLPCASPTPRVYSNSGPLSQWCHPTISSSVVPFSSHLQSFPASGPFQMSQFFTSGSQSIGVSASASVLPMNIQDCFPLGWTGWISLLTLKSLLQQHSSKASVWHSAFFIVQLSHPYITTGKTKALTSWTFVGKVMSLLFNMLSRLVIIFLPRSKRLLISWLQSPSAVISEPPKIKVCPCFHCFIFAMKWWDRCQDLSFLNVEF